MPRAEPPAKPAVVRKRNRKRKRRVVSSSSSSGSSSDSTSDGDDAPTIRRPVAAKATSSSSSSSSDSSSDSDSDAVVQPSHPVDRTLQREAAPTNQNRMRSPSVSPPPAPIPSFLPPKTTSTAQSEENEQILKDRFRKFWMASVADGFKDDLEQIRKEPGLTTSRLAMLIDSLASGADVYSSTIPTGGNGVNEMEVVLDS